MVDNFSVNAKGGKKDNNEKLKWSLLPFDAFPTMVEVLMYGAKKYSADNWRKVDKEEYVDAALRHFISWLGGEAIDSESGFPHLAHLLCDVAFLNAMYKKEPFKHLPKNLETL